MKSYRIIKAFDGSQTGHDFNHFPKGSVHSLSDDLATIAVKEGWAVEHNESTAEDRETKINEPDEKKKKEKK